MLGEVDYRERENTEAANIFKRVLHKVSGKIMAGLRDAHLQFSVSQNKQCGPPARSAPPELGELQLMELLSNHCCLFILIFLMHNWHAV